VIDDRSVPYIVLIVAVLIVTLGRPVVRRSRTGRRRPRPGAETIERLAETLGIGIIVQSIEVGPPAAIAASLLLDTRIHRVLATGPSEDAAWDDLARQALKWKNDDPRNARTYFGGF
jgi:hypothetical protein